MVQKINGAAYAGIWVERKVSFVKIIFNKDLLTLPNADLTVLGTSTSLTGAVATSALGGFTTSSGVATLPVVESAVVQALKFTQTKATPLALSNYTVLPVYQSAAGATNVGAVITVGSTVGLFVGMTVTMVSGTGTIPAATTVVSVNSATTFTVSAAPTVALSASAVVRADGSAVDVMLGFAEGWFSDINGVISVGNTLTDAQAVLTTASSSPVLPIGSLVSVSPTALTFAMQFVYLNGTLPVATFANKALLLGVGSTPGSSPTNSTTGTPGYYPL